jgi:hypothetical protein
MATTLEGNGAILAAEADAVGRRVHATSIQFQGTGLTAGQEWRVTDGKGNTLGRGYVDASHVNIELLVGCKWCQDVVFASKPAAGTSRVVVTWD